MDEDLIKFVEVVSCVLSVFSIWVCYICVKTRQREKRTPLLNPVILA